MNTANANASERLTHSKNLGHGLLPMALVLGMSSGLIEGVLHMGLQRLNVLEQVWYQIFWISAAFNAAALGLAALVLSFVLAKFPQAAWLRFGSVFAVILGALLPCLALGLKEWIYPSSILVLTLGLAVVITRGFFRAPERNVRFFRRSLPAVATITTVVFIGIQGGLWLRASRATANLPPAPADAPDVLVLVLDTLRADHLGAYGYARDTSPTIDRLAKEGVLFEHAFSSASYSLQSHVSMLTGLYTYQHGATWMTSKTIRNPAFPVLPETLQRHGYVTGAFSANTFWFAREHGFGRGFIHFDDYFYSVKDSLLRTAYGRLFTRTLLSRFDEDIPARKRATYTNEAVLKWMNRNSDHPAFVMVNYFDVHDPYLPIEPYRRKFSTVSNPGGLINSDFHVPETLSAADLQSEIDAYDGAISYLDAQIGHLLESLRDRKSKRDLLLVLTSDHGEEFGEDGGFTHGHNLHIKTIHVPLIVWQPNRLPQGIRVSQPVTTAAIPATVMDAIGGESGVFQGPSLQTLWTSPEPPATWPYPLSELEKRDWEPERVPIHHGSLLSLISPTHHFIQHETQGARLFDLGADPLEKNNLIDSPEMRSIVEDFRKVARERCGSCPKKTPDL